MYLNYCKTHHTEILTPVDQTYAFYFPELFAKAKGGMSYPVIELAKSVWIDHLPPIEGKTAFILAGGNGIFAGASTTHYRESELYYEYKVSANALSQIIAHRESLRYGKMDLVFTDHSACASSLHVLMHAQSLLTSRAFARVIVLAVDDAVNAPNLQFFKERGVRPSAEPSAFDTKNHGFYLGQGAVTCVFENAPTEDVIARVRDCASASEDNTNSLGMREDGQGYIKAIRALSPRAVDSVVVIKTHGTGTPMNDQAERRALQECFFEDYIATSYKPSIGHTMGASGLLESVLLLKHLRRWNTVPAIANRTELDTVFVSHVTKAPRGGVLALSAGMGNLFSAVVWERY